MELSENIRNAIERLAEENDSFYLYDEQGIIDRAELLKSNFPDVDFIYSAKCNPDGRIVRALVSQGLGIDAASVQECLLANECKVDRDDVFYSAPGKTEKNIRESFRIATPIADSIGELERFNQYVEKHTGLYKAFAGIRINPDFGFGADSGVPSKFGIDEEEVFRIIRERSFDHIYINGIHVHVKSQVLSAELMLEYYERVLELAERVENELGHQLKYINMGSGLGIPYTTDTAPIDIEWLGKQVGERVANFKESHPDTRLIIETGRFVVCPNGYYVTHVADRKTSHGKTYIILQNTLNGFLRPSIARLVEKYANLSGWDGRGTLAGTEPLYSGSGAPEILTLAEDNSECETVTLVGNLCTGADVVAEGIELPKLSIGDVVILPNAGAYGAVLSPMQFASMERPIELILNA